MEFPIALCRHMSQSTTVCITRMGGDHAYVLAIFESFCVSIWDVSKIVSFISIYSDLRTDEGCVFVWIWWWIKFTQESIVMTTSLPNLFPPLHYQILIHEAVKWITNGSAAKSASAAFILTVMAGIKNTM